jgi:hypothetical protein
MHIPSPFIKAAAVIAAAVNAHRRPIHHHRAAVTYSFDVTAGTSRHGRQQQRRQPNLDLLSHTGCLVHTDLPFADEIRKFGCSRTTTSREFIAKRNILAA